MATLSTISTASTFSLYDNIRSPSTDTAPHRPIRHNRHGISNMVHNVRLAKDKLKIFVKTTCERETSRLRSRLSRPFFVGRRTDSAQIASADHSPGLDTRCIHGMNCPVYLHFQARLGVEQ